MSTAPLAEPNAIATVRLGSGSASPDASGEIESLATGRSSSSGAAALRIGRYEVLEVIGAGSTGTVYRAYDRPLGRDVSIKLLHATSADLSLQAEAQGRLLREAQVLARLSHQNVVAAYDVGTHEGALFISMEFIEGTSLRDWLAQPRRRDEVLRVLVSAGRGLAAAHAGGVLHRDFKPANVMVSSDGRVRVVDFGLARPAGAAPEAGPHATETSLCASARLQSRGPASSHTLTRTAGIIGTPGFIPPEQWLGGTIDHRSDQFSYAVTAFIALTGQKPYPEVVDPTELRFSTSARTPWPRSVPRALRRIVDRGLSTRPEHRYPSLTVMVNALERFTLPERRRASRLAIGAAFVASIALPGAVSNPMGNTALCNVDDAALVGVWDPNLRERVERAFLATGNRHAGEAFALVSQRLDLFRNQWLAMRRSSCEATLVRGEQEERVMLLRATCLDRALEGTKTLVGALLAVDAKSMNRMTEASPATVTGCADAAALLGSTDQLPADPSLRAIIDEVEVGLVVNQALLEGSRGSEVVEHAQHILELARTTHHQGALAKATAQLGRATLRMATTSEQRKAGEAILNESLRLAALAGDDQLLARTATFLFYTIANAQARTQEGEAMLPIVEALVWRAGNPPLPRIELLYSQNTALVRHSKVQAAAALLEEAIRLAEENVGTEFQRLASTAALELGHVYAYMDRFAESEAIALRGVDGMRRLFGSHHPRLLSPLANLAVLQGKAGHLELALDTLAEYRALADSMPADEPRRMWVPLIESRVWRVTGHCDRAVPLQREALATFSAAQGPEHPLTVNVMGELGRCLAETNHVPEAISLLEHVLGKLRASHDATIPDAALNLAQALGRVPAQRARARALAEEARALWLADDAPTGVSEAEQWLAAHPL